MIKFEFQMFDFFSISSLGPLLFSGSKKFSTFQLNFKVIETSGDLLANFWVDLSVDLLLDLSVNLQVNLPDNLPVNDRGNCLGVLKFEMRNHKNNV